MKVKMEVYYIHCYFVFQAQTFRGNAVRLRRKMWWQNKKMCLILIFVLLVIIGAIVLVALGVQHKL